MKTIAIASLALLLTACASSGHPISQDQIDQIVKGKTTQSELLANLGTPTSQAFNSDGTKVLTWAYAYVGFAGIGTETQALSVIVGPDGRVAAYTANNTGVSPGRLGR